MEEIIQNDNDLFFMNQVILIDNECEEELMEKKKKKYKQDLELNEIQNYIKGINDNYEKKTKEILIKFNKLNKSKIEEEEKLDGYYSIVTSEENLSDLELRNIYKGLSKIEETFKITKSEFDARPINVRLEDHIDAHFLICFISLVIIRLLQYDINNKYTIKNILEKMKNFKVTHETGNLYKFIGYKPEIQYLNRKLDIEMDKKYDTRENIKKILKY